MLLYLLHIVCLGDNNNNPKSVAAILEYEEKVSSDTDSKLESEYAFITLDGKKWPVPKSLLRDDYLRTAEDAPPPEQCSDDQSTKAEASSEVNCDGEIEQEQVQVFANNSCPFAGFNSFGIRKS